MAMKKIYAFVGPYVASNLILLVVDTVAGIVLAYVNKQGAATCGITPQMSVVIYSYLVQTSIVIALIVGVVNVALGTSYLLKSRSKKEEHRKPDNAKKLFLRGSISLVMLILIYLLVYFLTSFFGISCSGPILPQF